MMGAVEDPQSALAAAVIELERHCASDQWSGQPRLYALVPTAELIDESPELARRAGVCPAAAPDAWTAVEQPDFAVGDDLAETLHTVAWPDRVQGCAIAMDRSFLPAAAEAGIPPEPAAATEYVAQHPDRQDIRLVVGVTRAGLRYGVGRLARHPDELLGGPDFAPGIATLLAITLG